jgi:hypothetical protein
MIAAAMAARTQPWNGNDMDIYADDLAAVTEAQLQPSTEHPHGPTDKDFDALTTPSFDGQTSKGACDDPKQSSPKDTAERSVFRRVTADDGLRRNGAGRSRASATCLRGDHGSRSIRGAV